MNERLPDERIYPTTLRAVLLTAALVFGVAFGLNLLVLLLVKSDPEINLGYWLVQEKWRMVQELDEPVDWLILGDSSANQGVVPEVWNEMLGVSSVNLATTANALAANDAFLLEAYIDRFGPPQNVLMVHVYNVWHREGIDDLVLAQLPLELTFSPVLDRENQTAEFGDRTRAVMKRLTPLYFQDETIPELVKQPWRMARNSEAKRPEMTSTGFMKVLEPNRATFTGDLAMNLDFVRSSSFQISEQNKRALDRIIELGEQHGFDVYIANSPVYDALYEDEIFRDYYFDAMTGLAEYTSKSDRAHVLQSELLTFPLDRMRNVDHLIYESAMVYTGWLASRLDEQGWKQGELTRNLH